MTIPMPFIPERKSVKVQTKWRNEMLKSSFTMLDKYSCMSTINCQFLIVRLLIVTLLPTLYHDDFLMHCSVDISNFYLLAAVYAEQGVACVRRGVMCAVREREREGQEPCVVCNADTGREKPHRYRGPHTHSVIISQQLIRVQFLQKTHNTAQPWTESFLSSRLLLASLRVLEVAEHALLRY